MPRSLSFTASIIKSWFQYRCERQVVYDAMPRTDLEQIPDLKPVVQSEWSKLGVNYEDQVIEAMRQRDPTQVLGPPHGEKALPEKLALAFLRRQRREEMAYQVRLRTSRWLRDTLRLSDGISLTEGRADLVKVESDETGHPVFRIVDIKATQAPTLFHRTQIAFYSLMLRGWLYEAQLPGTASEKAEIWHFPAGKSEGEPIKSEFALRGYEAMVIDFFHRNAPKFLERTVDAGRDDTFFHIYFKCEACKYLKYCERAISGGQPSSWDVSAVPGMSHESKATLLKSGLSSVGQLATSGVSGLKSQSWALGQRAEMLRARAKSLLDNRCEVHENRYSLLMPPRVDLAIFLVVDTDPAEGNLLSIGCLIKCRDEQKFHISVLPKSDDRAESAALIDVLSQVVQALTWADAHNQDQPQEPIHAHIFVYEPSEAADLQRALGRHLDHPSLRKGLLHLVRIFPPEQVVPEPEYKGAQHLPATALRTIVEQLLSLPVRVTHDLRQVTQALAAASPPLTDPYVPDPKLERRFSSRLSVDAGRQLRSQEIAPELIEHDVTLRLRAMAGLENWLISANSRAREPFLRLKKAPFRFQETIDPLHADDLDILLAQQLLESRAALLSCLMTLAQPSAQRIARNNCYGNLRLEKHGSSQYGHWMHFKIPPESAACELSNADLDLILTRDEADVRLDPGRWSAHRVRIAPRDPKYGRDSLLVNVHHGVFKSASFQAMMRRAEAADWHIDQIHVDRTTERLVAFLRYISEGEDS